jgi:hypothetical protein
MVEVCSAGLELGEYVERPADWCGKDGSVLGQYIAKRQNKHRSYPHVNALAEITPKGNYQQVVPLADPFAGITRINVESIKPIRFKCNGYTEVVRIQGRNEYFSRDTCERCPYQREVEGLI